MGAELYLPEAWRTPARRATARMPATRRFAEKWRLALRLVRQVRAAGRQLEAVVADAGYGNVVALRTALTRLRVPFVLGIASDTTVFREPPPIRPRRPGPGRTPRGPGVVDTPEWNGATLANALPRRAWRTVSWRNGQQRPRRARFAAVRVTPVSTWRTHRRLQACWLLCERNPDPTIGRRFYVANLPPTATVTPLARLAHQRWAIEQQYADLKTELGLDHVEGRTYPGWQPHVVLGAVTHAFLQLERRRRHATIELTFPQMRAIAHEVFTGLLFITRPTYLKWLNAGRQYLQLRI